MGGLCRHTCCTWLSRLNGLLTHEYLTTRSLTQRRTVEATR